MLVKGYFKIKEDYFRRSGERILGRWSWLGGGLRGLGKVAWEGEAVFHMKDGVGLRGYFVIKEVVVNCFIYFSPTVVLSSSTLD